jgi:ferritin-like metal-binding protein YciE
VQYLNEAHASETSLTRVLESQIAMAPAAGDYRASLERHLAETRDHAERVRARLRELGTDGDPMLTWMSAVETAMGQAIALGKTPLDLLRGTSREEKVLRNAKDACATEALEVATYTALETLARSFGDEQTAALAASIRPDEERMLAELTSQLPSLADAVGRAELAGGSVESRTGRRETVRQAGRSARTTAQKTAQKGTARARSARGASAATRRKRPPSGADAAEADTTR